MQLILNKELISRKESKVKNTITIISTRKWLIEEISEKIRLTDFDNIKKLSKTYLMLSLLIYRVKLSVLLLT